MLTDSLRRQRLSGGCFPWHSNLPCSCCSLSDSLSASQWCPFSALRLPCSPPFYCFLFCFLECCGASCHPGQALPILPAEDSGARRTQRGLTGWVGLHLGKLLHPGAPSSSVFLRRGSWAQHFEGEKKVKPFTGMAFQRMVLYKSPKC